MSQQVYEPKLFAHGTVPGSRTYVNSEHEQSTVVVVRPKSVILTYVLWLFLGAGQASTSFICVSQFRGCFIWRSPV